VKLIVAWGLPAVFVLPVAAITAMVWQQEWWLTSICSSAYIMAALGFRR